MSDSTEDANLTPIPQDQSRYPVYVGDSQNPISVQLIQEIFTELTGKNESLTESFTKPYQIEFAHIEDLYHKITQMLEQYKIISFNCSAIIYYANSTKDELSSFDRLSFQRSSSSSPVESIFIKYSFLTVLPKTSKTQTYTISIRIASGIAIRKRFENEIAFGAPLSIIRLMGDRTAYAKIEYVDYAVARNVLAAIKDWFSTIPHSQRRPILEFIQKRSHRIPRIVRFITVIFSGIFCYQATSKYLPLHPQDLTYLAQLLIGSFILVYGAYVTSNWLGEYAESSLDRWSSLSYIKFNKGDELEISKFAAGNRASIGKAVFGLLGALSMSVFTKIIAALLLSYFVGTKY